MANVNNQTLTLIFIGVTALAVLLQAGILLGIFITVRKSVKAIHSEVEVLRAATLPLLDNTRELVKGVTPKIESVATDIAEVARGLRVQTMEFHASASDILERVHRQTGRVDTMVSGALDTVDRASTVVNDAVNVPLRQLSGIAAFAKAAFDALRSNGPRRQAQPTRPAGDKDLFV